jgi:hypothetical protein
METHIKQGWTSAIDEIRAELPSKLFSAFGLDVVHQVENEMLSTFNARNFPRTKLWYENHHNHSIRWFKSAYGVFDFRSRRGYRPSGNVKLYRRYRGWVVELTCKVNRAVINTREAINEYVGVNLHRPMFSTTCGRAVLEILEWDVTRLTTREAVAYVHSKLVQQARKPFSSAGFQHGSHRAFGVKTWHHAASKRKRGVHPLITNTDT